MAKVQQKSFNRHTLERLRKDLKARDPRYLGTTTIWSDPRQEVAHLRLRISPQLKATYYIEFRLDSTRSTTTHNIGDFRKIDLDTAISLAQEAWTSIARGIHPKKAQRIKDQRNGPTLREAMETKIRERGEWPKKNGLKPASIESMRKHMRVLQRHGFSDRYMLEITSEDVKELRRAIPLEIQERGGKRGSGDATAAKVVGFVNELYRFSISYFETEESPPRKVITYNPCDPLRATKAFNAKSGKSSKKKRGTIAQNDLKKVWHEFKELENYVTDRHNKNVENHVVASYYLRFQLLTGLRGGAVSGIRFDMYNPRRKTLDFFGEDKKLMKSGDDFLLPLCNEAISIIERMKERHGGNSDFVFPNATGSSGAAIGVPVWLEKVRKKSGVYFRSHDLRGTFMTIGEAIDVPLNVIKQLVDHGQKVSDVTVLYLDTEVETLRLKLNKITDFILEEVGEKKPEKEEPSFKLSDNPFNIKPALHEELERLAETEGESLKDIYERCLKLGTLALKCPQMKAEDLLVMLKLA